MKAILIKIGDGLLVAIMCAVLLTLIFVIAIPHSPPEEPEPLNQSESYTVPVGRDFQEPYMLEDKK